MVANRYLVIVPAVVHGGTTSCEWSRIARLIVWSVARCYDWRYDRSHDATIDRTIGRTMLRLIVRSIARCYDWSYDRPQDATIDRTLGHRMSRLIVRIGRRTRRLIARSVVGRKNWSCICRWSLPLVGRFLTMHFAIDSLQSFVIARPRAGDGCPYRPSE